MSFAMLIVVAIIGLFTMNGETANFFCADASKVTAYMPGFDASQPPACQSGSTRFQIPNANADQQDALYKSTAVHSGALCSTMACYLKGSGNLMVAMTGDRTTGERKVVDDAIQVTIDTQTAKNTELINNDFCNSMTEAQIAQKIATIKANNEATINGLDSVEAAITAATTVPTLRTAVIAMNDAHQAAEFTLNTRLMSALEKIARCEFAKR